MANPSTPASRGMGSPDQTSLTVDKIKSDAASVTAEAQTLASTVAQEATEQFGQIAEEAKAQAAAAVNQAKGLAVEQKDLLVGQIGGVVEAIQRVAGDLEASNGAAAPYARMLADNAEQLSSTIKNNDVDALLNMAQDFGRRQPAAFVGVSVLLGFAASRLLLASGARMSAVKQTEEDPSPSEYASTPASTNSAQPEGRV